MRTFFRKLLRFSFLFFGLCCGADGLPCLLVCFDRSDLDLDLTRPAALFDLLLLNRRLLSFFSIEALFSLFASLDFFGRLSLDFLGLPCLEGLDLVVEVDLLLVLPTPALSMRAMSDLVLFITSPTLFSSPPLSLSISLAFVFVLLSLSLSMLCLSVCLGDSTQA